MNDDRTITLPRVDLRHLHWGNAVSAVDDNSNPVMLVPDGVSIPDAFTEWSVVELDPASLDLIEQPEGLVVEDTTGTTGWKIRMETP